MIDNKIIYNGDWFKRHGQASETITSIAYRLEAMSNSFFDTGNNHMGERLYSYSEDLLDVQKACSNAIGESITETLKRSQENSETILKAALAGALTSNPEDEGGKEFARSLIEGEDI